jgi:hypothetical protein
MKIKSFLNQSPLTLSIDIGLVIVPDQTTGEVGKVGRRLL